MKKIFSFDAETNGLWGKAFSTGAVVIENGKEVATFVARCPIHGEINPWVAENVLPQMQDIKITHNSYEDMLQAFATFYMQNKADADIIVHMGTPVESRVILDMHDLSFIGDWDAPYPLIDISAIPVVGTSVDTYNTNNNIVISQCTGGTHNPLYDSRAAGACYQHFLSKK